MNRIFLFILVLLLIVFGAYYGLSRYYHINSDAIINMVAPPGDDIRKYLPGADDVVEENERLSIPDASNLSIFADLEGIGTPRVLAFDNNGVLVASLPGEGKVVALPDKDNDGVFDKSSDILANANRPHGIAFDSGMIYIAETDKVVRYEYDDDGYKAVNPKTLFSLPGGGRHYTRTIKIHDGKLYTSVGSSCDVCVEDDEKRSTILVSNLDGSDLRVFASGLRNTVFFDFDEDGRLWGSDMGRDFLGDNLPPDELNIIIDGGDYGWPYCYGQKVRDEKFRGDVNVDYCDKTIATEFNYPAHIAPLGTTFINSKLLQEDVGDLLVAFHGSWNSSTPVGYKIVKINIENGHAVSMEDFITGFIKSDGTVLGRPVDLVFDDDGELYISDDKANKVYVLSSTETQ